MLLIATTWRRRRFFQLPNFPVAVSSVAVFSRCLFYRCRFCRESRSAVVRSQSTRQSFHHRAPSTRLTSRWASRVDNLHTSQNMLEHDSFLPRGIWYGLVSVRLSVRSRCFTITARHRITQTIPHDSPGTLVFWRQRSPRNSAGVNPYRGAKCRCCG